MRRAERVVGALRPPGEAREPAALRAACGCGRAGRSGSCADSTGGRRPRSACRCGVLKTAWIATVSSTTPRPGAEVPAGHARPPRSSRRAARRRAAAARRTDRPFRSGGQLDAVEQRRRRSRIGHRLRPPRRRQPFAREDELRRRPQVPGRRAVGRQRLARLADQLMRLAPRAVEPEQRDEGRLALRRRPCRSRLPAASASPSTSRMSSRIWKASPSAGGVAAAAAPGRSARGSRPTPPPSRTAPRSSAPAGRSIAVEVERRARPSRRRCRAPGRRPCPRAPAACASRQTSRACSRGSIAACGAARISKASVCSASPASTAVASSQALCTVGLPRRRSSSSMQGRSSCTRL